MESGKSSLSDQRAGGAEICLQKFRAFWDQSLDDHFFDGGGGGYSGNLSLLVSARFTSSSSKSRDGLMTVVGTPPGRLLTSGSLPAAIRAVRRARVSSSLKMAPRTSSS